MPDTLAPLTIPPRFRGPTSSGNGGWSAGALAAYLAPGTVRVMLRTPPPLGVPLTVELLDDEHGNETARATRDDQLVAEAAPAEADVTPVPAVDAATARAAESSYAGFRSHPFPSCFACGTDRGPGDGLRIFPGRVADTDDGSVRMAATWTPDPSLGGDAASLPVTWAALDCIGGWAGDLEQRLMVLGSMTAHVRDLPRVGERHVLVGSARGSKGRRTFTAATLYAADGRVLGSAEHIWIAVDPEDFA
ncbi:hypothetical protein [Nocardioides sp.]|uniref:hypothetical protein n=1 Tax=Nocardioides sp. TaxID=35761 RepID=UPI0027273F51|nr:hypothetical protein [Nocardioides sp.]MDO9455357.1 hypothetical protein [Nocardioides sp.]